MNYWEIVYPDAGGHDQRAVFSDNDILKYYFVQWCKMYAESGREMPAILEQAWIDDWVVPHAARKHEPS